FLKCGNHRKSLVENLDESLKQLGTGYIDIMYVHSWEFRTPIEEVMRSLDDVVLYIAISNTPAWVISCTNKMADLRGWSRFIGLQTRYNLLERSLEYDLQSACAEFDILDWKIHQRISSQFKKGRRSQLLNYEFSGKNEQNWKILDEVKAIAAETKRNSVQVALNWISQKPGITSLIGARTKAQLVENPKALEFKLTPEQMARLDAISAPKEIPFPYYFYPSLDKLVGKGIQTRGKFKPMLRAGETKILDEMFWTEAALSCLGIAKDIKEYALMSALITFLLVSFFQILS
ncbi:1356_t:CDS:2, partial [Dentiscutata heterogama]